MKTNSVLIILPTWVGDFVMATPTLRAMRNRFVDAHITSLGEANLADLVDGGDWMDETLWYPPKHQRHLLSRDCRTLISTLRKRRFDLALLLPNSFRSGFIAFLAGAKHRVGFDRDGRGMFLTDKLTPPNKVGKEYLPQPIVELYADLAEHLGCDRPGDGLELFCTEACDTSLCRKLADRGYDGRLTDNTGKNGSPLVVICPGAKYGAAKCWFPDRFAGVADRLIQSTGATVVVTCGPGEETIARAINESMQHDALVFDEPRLSLGELKSLISHCDLLLCNDAGPRHFAKAFDVPVVTVFGPTDPKWTNTSYARERIMRIDIECGPCQERICPLGHLECLKGVTVDAVFAACLHFINEPSTTKPS